MPSKLSSTLVTLDFSANQNKRLPPILQLLKRWRYISWKNNPIEFPPRIVLSQGMETTMNYLLQHLTETLPSNTTKLVIVGKQHAEKITLIHALKSRRGIVSNPQNITKTEGVNITETKFENINFKIFDLAGDDNYLESLLI